MQIFNTILSGMSALLLFLSIALPPSIALAAHATSPISAPRIEGFDVQQVPRLIAGEELVFTLYGTPGGSANVRINGAVGKLDLDEVEIGVYEGTYTVKRNDRLAANTTVTANLRLGNQIATVVLDESLQAGAPSTADRTAALAAAAVVPKIDRFELDPPAHLQSGEQLFFTLYGTPAGKASIRIAGVKGKLLMEEVQSGIYEATYAIKERDGIKSDATVTATLYLNNHDSSAVLNRPLSVAATPAPSTRRAARFCPNCGIIEAINVIEVKGEGSYVGKIAGGVVGGLLGSQIGKGRGKTAAQIAGVVGGVVAGNEVEKRVKKTQHYEVITRLQGGGVQTVTYATAPAFKVGDKVRVENNLLVLE